MGGLGGGRVCQFPWVTSDAPDSLFSVHTAFSGDDFGKGMTNVDMPFASVRRLIDLLSLFACSMLTNTQHSAWCPMETPILSKTAPQSRICVESRAIPHAEVALNCLIKPAVGRDMRQEKGQTDCQITDSQPLS